MSVKYFVDLDGVLADWIGPALTLLGHDVAEVCKHWNTLTPRPWNVFDVLDVPASQAWRYIEHAGDRFWSTLPMLPHARELIRECQALGETTILTSPSTHPSSYAGKVQWLDHHFGRGFARKHALIGASKHVVARPGAVLIDDSPAHCDAWATEGGTALLFPGYGNDLHAHRDRAFAYIRPALLETRR